MKKKVGIATFHRANNYGAVLQAFALQETLKSFDEIEDVEFIDYRDKNIEGPYKPFSFYGRTLKSKVRKVAKDILYFNKNSRRNVAFSKFIKENIKCSKSFYQIENIEKEKYDICITGSDQVWNPNIVGELSDFYTLNFCDDRIRKISYAASIGLNSIEEKYNLDFRSKLYKLDKISVREENAKKILKGLIDNEIDIVLDPTLLLSKEDWDRKIVNRKEENERYILAYAIAPNEEYINIVNYLSEEKKLKVISFDEKTKFKNSLRSAYCADPFEFINLIKNAEYIVANSFHATVFSILYNKNFLSVPHKGTSSRILDLLNMLDIKNAIYYSLEDFKTNKWKFDNDWNLIEEKLKLKRDESIMWLRNAIK